MQRSRRRTPLPAVLASCLVACGSIEEEPAQPISTGAEETSAAVPMHQDPLHRHFHDLELKPDLGSSATWYSEVISDGAPFTEALPSWNVPRALAPFTVEIRTKEALDGDDWTPWLRIGDWEVQSRGDDVPTAHRQGEVAVDVLRLEAPMEACQLRIVATDHGIITAPQAMHVTLTDARDIEDRVRSAAEEPWPGTPVSLDVPRRAQRVEGGEVGGRICSPTSVAMVVAYHGRDVPTMELADAILDPHFGIYGNWNRAVQGAFAAGVPGELVRVSSWETVASYLRSGRPLVASVRAEEGELTGAPYKSTRGHLLVVRGLDGGGAVLVNDPAAASPATVARTYSRADMERVWFAGSGGVTYALAAPEASGAEK